MLLRSGVPDCDTRGSGVSRTLHGTSKAAQIDLTSTRPFTIRTICCVKCTTIHSTLLLQEACHGTCHFRRQSPNTFAVSRRSKYCADKLRLHPPDSLPVLSLPSATHLFTTTLYMQSDDKTFCYCVCDWRDSTAPSGPGPPYSQGF